MKLEELRELTKKIGIPQTIKEQQEIQEFFRASGIEPGNFYQELEMSSRFVETHQDTSFTNSAVNLHSHTFYEVLCCRNTCGVEYLVGTERYRLQKGDIIMVHPGISHRPLIPETMTEPYKRDVLWLSVDFFKTMQQTFPDERLYENTGTHLLRTAGTRWEFLADKFRQGVKEAERKDVGWEAAVVANAMELMVLLRRAILDKNTKALKAEKPELLDQVLSYVEGHLSEKINLSDMARHFYVSESTISQTFRKKMGVSFYRCVTQRRLIAAKLLIAEGMLLDFVGQQVGFSDYSTFYRAFKQEYGLSPRQYRKMLEEADRTL